MNALMNSPYPPLPVHFADISGGDTQCHSQGESSCLFRRLLSKVGFRLVVRYEPSAARRKIEDALHLRPRFLRSEWEDYPLHVDDIEHIFSILASGDLFSWPNHFFVPADPLASVLCPGINEYAFEESLIRLKREVGVCVDHSLIRRLLAEDRTVGELIQLVGGPQV
jgi:hypothetical protein